METMFAKYVAQARKSKRENRMIFNHVCIRVENLDAAIDLFRDSFGIDNFLSPGGETFDQEREFRVAWLDDHDMYLELSEFEKAQEIGYDTGVGQPIGHLSEIGFFVPDMEKAMEKLGAQGWEVTSAIEVEGAKMYKISNLRTPGIPVELIDYEADDWKA
jgi:catechol 2,3-dioxygenase-like lactoylglutathione lyase family enzyme